MTGSDTVILPAEAEPLLDVAVVKPALTLDMLGRVLANTQDQIRFADSKAGFLAAFHALLFGTVVTSANRLAAISPDVRNAAFWAACSLLAVYGLVTVTAVGLIVLSVMSRSRQLTPDSRLFFGHILKRYGADYQRYFREARATTDEQWAEQLAAQVVEVSHIAALKHRLVRWAALCTLCDLILWGAVFVALMPLPR